MKYIYALIDPRTRQIRYVGQTDDLSKRLQQHIMDKSNTPKTEWIKGLLAANLRPDIIQLAQIEDEDNAHMIEYRWVYFGRKNGWELTNTVGMKSEDYYSLQGYFERLIVEMEKPEDVSSKQYTMADARQELINLLVKTIKGIHNFKQLSMSPVSAIVFYAVSLSWCLTQSIIHQNSSAAKIGGLVSAVTVVGSIILVLVWADNEIKDNRSISKFMHLAGLLALCAGFVVMWAS